MTRKRWRNPDKRMARAVELRAQGWSLRRIGTELAVDEKTIRNDLARWTRESGAQETPRPQLRVVRNQRAEFRPDSASEVRINSAEGEAG